MRALVVTADAELVVETRPDPEPGPGEVLVRVHGAGLNRADLVQLSGNYAAPPGSPPDIPGSSSRARSSRTAPGVDRARGGRPGVRHRRRRRARPSCSPCPPRSAPASPNGSTSSTAGGVPEVFITAHDAHGHPGRDPAGARPCSCTRSAPASAPPRCSSAKALGCTVVGTARTAEKLERCRELGLDHAVLAPRELDPDVLAADITAAAGPVDVTLELVGGGYVATDLAVAGAARSHRRHRPDGRRTASTSTSAR